MLVTWSFSCKNGANSMLEDANIKDTKDVEGLIRPPVKDNNSRPTHKSNSYAVC
ncbi:hypothetical protein Hanom_Chr06g00517361 [Helianthus anomalus]